MKARYLRGKWAPPHHEMLKKPDIIDKIWWWVFVAALAYPFLKIIVG